MPNVTIFTTDVPSFYLLEQIYDSRTNPTGTIVPRPNSLVLDPANNGLLRRVASVDPTTMNSTYASVFTSLLAPPINDLDPSDSSVVSIIDYGNSRFYLFYDKAENPTKLTIDKKVIILGDDAKMFEIAKYDTTLQQYVPISLYYDTDGTYRGTKIPLAEIGTANDAKVPTNCHTKEDLVEGQVYHLIVYDYAGTQCGALSLFAKKALINNAYEDELIIEDLVIEATQKDANGLYLFPDQDPGSLVITPRLVYNNGTSRVVGIDNELCHMYGLEDFTAAYPGQSVEVLIKYFLASTQQATGPCLESSGNTRYLIKETTLTVKDPGTNEYSLKILTVPIYIASISKWTLMFYLYVVGDSMVRNITSLVTVTGGFDGRLMGVDQSLMLTFKIRDVFPAAVSDYIYQQPLVIRVAPYSYYERYVMRDTLGDAYGIYGVDAPAVPRPVIYYNSTSQQHCIPTSKFLNKAMMLEAFYYKGRPLFDSSLISAPSTPSHFTLRNAANGTLLLAAPIAVENYEQTFSLVGVTNQNDLVGSSCIVEFLVYENGQYTVLWGEPVDVYQPV